MILLLPYCFADTISAESKEINDLLEIMQAIIRIANEMGQRKKRCCKPCKFQTIILQVDYRNDDINALVIDNSAIGTA